MWLTNLAGFEPISKYHFVHQECLFYICTYYKCNVGMYVCSYTSRYEHSQFMPQIRGQRYEHNFLKWFDHICQPKWAKIFKIDLS
jgi:hypothetical protein